MLITLEGKLSHDTVHVVGVTGVSGTRPLFQALKFKLGKFWITYQFLYMPNSPKPWLGRNLLEKLEAYNQTVFSDSNMCICNVAIIKGCDLVYKAPVFTIRLLIRNYTLYCSVTPTSIGMDLSTVKGMLECVNLQWLSCSGREASAPFSQERSFRNAD